MDSPANQSEVARFREQIEAEYQLAEWAKSGIQVGTAKHLFISRRMERIGEHQQSLAKLVGEEKAMQIVCELFEGTREIDYAGPLVL